MLNGFTTEIRRSKRRTVSVELLDETTVLVRAPLRMPKIAIEAFLREKEGWIRAHAEKMKDRSQSPDAYIDPLNEKELAYLKKMAKQYLPGRVAHFAEMLGVSYGRIAVRAQKTCFGSCSAKGNLNFNCVLMRMPPGIIDYVVVHELCHRLHMDHSRAFWDTVGQILPDYKEKRKWLRENGRFYIEAMKKEEML